MLEIIGNLWDYAYKENFRICITTNGFVKSNGECVMGRGCALEAKERYPQLPKLLGNSITAYGNKLNLIYLPDTFLVSFPVKHHWKEQADINLIKKSAESLNWLSTIHPHLTFILPKPGCGNGSLNWNNVKKVIEPILNDKIIIIDRY